MDPKVQKKEFWSILINSMKMSAGPMGHPHMLVEVQFIFVTRIIRDMVEDYVPWYLTAPGKPIEIIIPPWFFDKTADKISYREVLNRFVRIFKNEIGIIPPKPIDIPIHKIPPIKRKAFLAAYKKMAEGQFLVKPPGEGG